MLSSYINRCFGGTLLSQMVKQAVYRLEDCPKEPKGSGLHQLCTFIQANYDVNKQTYKVTVQKVLKQMMEIGEVRYLPTDTRSPSLAPLSLVDSILGILSIYGNN